MAFLINGEKVSDEVIEEEFESIKEHYINAGEVVCCDRDEEFMNYARENVVNRVLLEQASIARFGEVSDAEVDAKFKQIIAEHGGENEFYDNTGFNRGDEFMLRRKVKSSLMVDRYLEAELGEHTDPTDAEIQAFYEENIDKYMTGVEVEVSQLFIEPSSHESAKETYEDMYQARKEMLQGADFLELGARLSGLEQEEMNMGYVGQGQNMPEIEAQIFSMEPGEISPILATPFGFHMFKVTGRRDPRPIPAEEIPDLEEAFLKERHDNAVNEVIARLRQEGTVEETAEQPA